MTTTMQRTAQERAVRRVHIQLTRLFERYQQRFQTVPQTHDERRTQRIQVEVLLEFTLRYVSELLPEDIQTIVEQMLEFEHRVWFRDVEERPEP
jgi:hypothetical protein